MRGITGTERRRAAAAAATGIMQGKQLVRPPVPPLSYAMDTAPRPAQRLVRVRRRRRLLVEQVRRTRGRRIFCRRRRRRRRILWACRAWQRRGRGRGRTGAACTATGRVLGDIWRVISGGSQ